MTGSLSLLLLFMVAMASAPSDAELVRRFQEGDRTAFDAIVHRYQHRVFTLCMRWIGDEQVASEVAQDVFIAMYRKLGSFRGDAKLSTWVYRVVINHCKNRRLYRRRRHMDQHEPLEGTRAAEDDDAPSRQIASEEPLADAGVHRSEAAALLHEGLAALDESQRQIIVLRDIEDLSYEEIGELLGVPRGTVKSRLHRARAQLATLLGRQIDQDDLH
ncbi:MAG: sigma-70 family RNA polymerase sigma factor [Deltaproteobacteria bacterium]|nr:MAG: sigma-70 family RNA polymerase sigma factor [Deltaproteobacteria bacterium]